MYMYCGGGGGYQNTLSKVSGGQWMCLTLSTAVNYIIKSIKLNCILCSALYNGVYVDHKMNAKHEIIIEKDIL